MMTMMVACQESNRDRTTSKSLVSLSKGVNVIEVIGATSVIRCNIMEQVVPITETEEGEEIDITMAMEVRVRAVGVEVRGGISEVLRTTL